MFAMAQDGEAPPAIAQWGITNWASHMPPQLAAGGLAPGSLIRIRGWRLGGATADKVTIRIRSGESSVTAVVMAAGENELEALVPEDTPAGNAMLQVVKNGQPSLEWPVTIVDASFGAFARNGQGWGPGEITNAGDMPNSEARAARPGETVKLAGTGLGIRRQGNVPQVLVAGRAAKNVRLIPRTITRPGVDQIEFDLPHDSPDGCYIPVQVGTAPGIYSNAVTLAISRGGGRCTNAESWTSIIGSQPIRLATMALLHADLLLSLTAKENAHYPVDAGFASFAEIEPGALANPLFLLPPSGTCTAYSGTAGLHSITSPLAALEALPGTRIDAGPTVTVSGSGGSRLLPRERSARGNYSAVIGGRSPAPGAKELPLFLTPGGYRLSAPGGTGVGALHVDVRVAPPLVWRNREQLTEVIRGQGVSVTWSSPAGGLMLVVAMNVDSRSGALGVCTCVAKAKDGSFRIPPYALANIPQSPEHPRGFPLNLLILANLPENPLSRAAETRLDRIVAFAASVSARTVLFK
jgi:uncharacterized protein (TIGR03437 family)